MSALTADSPRVFEHGHDSFKNEFNVVASGKIYDGSAVGLTTGGNARALVAGDPFAGFASEGVDNSTGAAGAKRVKVGRKGVVKLAVTGVTGVLSDIGATVYASSDNDFTLTSTSNTAIGKVARIESGTTCLVTYESADLRSI